jgi:hypothetical protein
VLAVFCDLLHSTAQILSPIDPLSQAVAEMPVGGVQDFHALALSPHAGGVNFTTTSPASGLSLYTKSHASQ